ncbi:MAG TPA: hypothetical protein VEX70_06155 [Pyrinomonadaceae bacterium]|jgi:hypothetical protein|nr:hypothetical protein [Pyrinomonadaceae bacterium]
MNLTNKILPVALVAALLGGTVGALVMRPKTNDLNTVASTSNLLPVSNDTNSRPATLRYNEALPATTNETRETLNVANTNSDEECYRAGFTEGFAAARESKNKNVRANNFSNATATDRVVYREAPVRRTRVARNTRASRQAYYDYEPRKRSFWSKHRDKLTVAMGAGGGALIGGLVGGKKGAAIGAIGGGAGSALYTYKIRNRDNRR